MSKLGAVFDGVVMLTWSDWHTELRSNRYHYAKRFAQELPVLFIQLNKLSQSSIKIVRGEFANLFIISIPASYSKPLLAEFKLLLDAFNIKSPLLWIYNSHFASWLDEIPRKFTVYHATEAYLSQDMPSAFKVDSTAYNELISVLQKADLLISVSAGVEESYIQSGKATINRVVIPNGCDYAYYAPDNEQNQKNIEQRKKNKIILYQGAIFNKLDYLLLNQLIKEMPDWTFHFCGRVSFNESEWQQILKEPNVKYLGCLSVAEIKEHMYNANVGIIPFTKADFLIERSLPLKAFEYLACGLPAVTVPIKALLQYNDAFFFADDVASFKKQIIQAANLSTDYEYVKKIMSVAKLQDYDVRFIMATDTIISKCQLKDIN